MSLPPTAWVPHYTLLHGDSLGPKQPSVSEFAFYCVLFQLFLPTLGLTAASGERPALRTGL